MCLSRTKVKEKLAGGAGRAFSRLAEDEEVCRPARSISNVPDYAVSGVKAQSFVSFCTPIATIFVVLSVA